jgi:hypothetical protein
MRLRFGVERPAMVVARQVPTMFLSSLHSMPTCSALIHKVDFVPSLPFSSTWLYSTAIGSPVFCALQTNQPRCGAGSVSSSSNSEVCRSNQRRGSGSDGGSWYEISFQFRSHKKDRFLEHRLFLPLLVRFNTKTLKVDKPGSYPPFRQRRSANENPNEPHTHHGFSTVQPSTGSTMQQFPSDKFSLLALSRTWNGIIQLVQKMPCLRLVPERHVPACRTANRIYLCPC